MSSSQAVEEEDKLCAEIVKGHPVVDSWGTLGMTPNCGIPAAGLFLHRCPLNTAVPSALSLSLPCHPSAAIPHLGHMPVHKPDEMLYLCALDTCSTVARECVLM